MVVPVEDQHLLPVHLQRLGRDGIATNDGGRIIACPVVGFPVAARCLLAMRLVPEGERRIRRSGWDIDRLVGGGMAVDVQGGRHDAGAHRARARMRGSRRVAGCARRGRRGPVRGPLKAAVPYQLSARADVKARCDLDLIDEHPGAQAVAVVDHVKVDDDVLSGKGAEVVGVLSPCPVVAARAHQGGHPVVAWIL